MDGTVSCPMVMVQASTGQKLNICIPGYYQIPTNVIAGWPAFLILDLSLTVG